MTTEGLYSLPGDVRENVMRTRARRSDIQERYDRARVVGRSKYHLANARDMIDAGMTIQARHEVEAALVALETEWPL